MTSVRNDELCFILFSFSFLFLFLFLGLRVRVSVTSLVTVTNGHTVTMEHGERF